MATAPAADQTIPNFPFFEVDGPTAVFGCERTRYLSRDEGYRVSALLRDEADAFSQLFYRGGRLSDHGFKLKPEYAETGMATIRGLMSSFAPPHESKEGTVALAIHHWCDRCEPTARVADEA